MVTLKTCSLTQLLLVFCFHVQCVKTNVVRRPDSLYKVTSNCNQSTNSLASVIVTTDVPMTIHVHCRNDHVELMKTSDGVHYVAHVGFTKHDGSHCIFKKNPRSAVYSIMVDLAWDSVNEKSSLLLVRDQYVVVCTYDTSASSKTRSVSVDTSKQLFNLLYENQGQAMTSSVAVMLVDSWNNIIDGIIPLGTMARLIITITGIDFARAQHCWVSNDLRNYTILTSGCGDGEVFRKTDGFQTVNKRIYSPYFSAFRLQGNSHLIFQCVVSACTAGVDCNGTSCARKNRRKRNTARSYVAGFQQDVGQANHVISHDVIVRRVSRKSNSIFVSSVAKRQREARYLENGLILQ